MFEGLHITESQVGAYSFSVRWSAPGGSQDRRPQAVEAAETAPSCPADQLASRLPTKTFIARFQTCSSQFGFISLVSIV